ncbi:MAG: hypothetical protein WBV82_29075 [Myxococcaceae bacterium]
MRTMLLSILLVSPAAWAVEPGQATFQRACAQCHTAKPPSAAKSKAPGTGKAPELGAVVRAMPYPKLRSWIEAPHKQKPKTGCDTRLVRRGELDGLMSYLQSAARPPLPPRNVLLEQNLERSVAQRKAALHKAKQQKGTRESRRGTFGGNQ